MNILNKNLEHSKAFQQSKLNNGDAKLEAFFGLSKEVKFCKRCLISNQRPSSSVEFKNKGQAKITIDFGLSAILKTEIICLSPPDNL